MRCVNVCNHALMLGSCMTTEVVYNSTSSHGVSCTGQEHDSRRGAACRRDPARPSLRGLEAHADDGRRAVQTVQAAPADLHMKAKAANAQHALRHALSCETNLAQSLIQSIVCHHTEHHAGSSILHLRSEVSGTACCSSDTLATRLMSASQSAPAAMCAAVEADPPPATRSRRVSNSLRTSAGIASARCISYTQQDAIAVALARLLLSDAPLIGLQMRVAYAMR